MSIISKNKIIPSERLIEKYKDSEEAKKLNLPEFEYLNVEIGITKEKYDYIKKKLKNLSCNLLYSLPDEIKEVKILLNEINYLYVGQISKTSNIRSGIGVLVSSEGDYYHCFWSNNLPCYQGVFITSNGSNFEGVIESQESLKSFESIKPLNNPNPINVVFLGSITGKTCIIMKLCNIESFNFCIGNSFQSKIIDACGIKYQLNLGIKYL